MPTTHERKTDAARAFLLGWAAARRGGEAWSPRMAQQRCPRLTTEQTDAFLNGTEDRRLGDRFRYDLARAAG
jgi:hypothetical protein